MTAPYHLLFAASFVLFGLAVSASSSRAGEIEMIPDCDYGTNLECGWKKVEECMQYVPCGYSPPLALKTCCKEKVTNIEYFYWTHAEDDAN
jgi:hypothetical protein